MTSLTGRNEPPLEGDSAPTARFPGPLPIGRWADLQISVGWSLPAMLILIVTAGWWLRDRPGNGDLPVLSGILAAAVVVGALWQAVVRLMVVRLLGGRPVDMTIRACGSWGRTAYLAGGTRWLAGCLVPLASFALAAWLAAMPPRGEGWAGVSLVPQELTGEFNAIAVVTASVWMLFLQALAQCLPLPGCHGREALAGIIEACGRRWSVAQRRRAAAWVIGLVAIGMLVGCLRMLTVEPPGRGIPRWPFLALLAGACWASRRMDDFSLDPSAAEPPFAATRLAPWKDGRSAAEICSVPPPAKAGHAPASRRRRLGIWYRRHRSTQRLRAAHRRERSEAVDAARLDEILERLHADGLESLTSEEKTVLRRVSERLRKKS